MAEVERALHQVHERIAAIAELTKELRNLGSRYRIRGTALDAETRDAVRTSGRAGIKILIAAVRLLINPGAGADEQEELTRILEAAPDETGYETIPALCELLRRSATRLREEPEGGAPAATVH